MQYTPCRRVVLRSLPGRARLSEMLITSGRGVATHLGEIGQCGLARSEWPCFNVPVMKAAPLLSFDDPVPGQKVDCLTNGNTRDANSAASSAFAGSRTHCAHIPRATRC
jgi:hypothetical protein